MRFFLSHYKIFLLVSVILGCNSQIDVKIIPNSSFSGDLLGQGASLHNLKLNGDNTLSIDTGSGTVDRSLTTISGLDITGLEGYWKLDGTSGGLIPNTSTIADQSGNGNDGNPIDDDSTMYYRTGKSLQSIELDGAGDTIEIANSANINISGTALTVMAWFKMDEGGSDDSLDVGIVCKGTGVNAEQYLISTDGDNDFTFRVTTNEGYYKIGQAGSFSDATWTHVAGTYDGANLRFYVNGTEVSKMPVSGTISGSDTPLYIGKRCSGDDRYLDGLVDEVSVWSRTLSQAEIQNILDSQSLFKGNLTSPVFDARKAINWNGLNWESVNPTLKPLLTNGGSDSGYQEGNVSMASVLHHFQLDEGAASASFLDQSGLSNDASCDSSCPTTGVSARLNQGASFDGVNQYIEVPHSADFLVPEGTVALWFKPSNISGGTSYSLWSKDASGYGSGGHLSLSINNNLEPQVRIQSNVDDYSVSGNSGVVTDKWQHMAVTFGSNGLKLYLNGVLQGTNPYTGGLDSASSGGADGNEEPIAIGAGTQSSSSSSVTPISSPFQGIIDESIFLGRQMSDAEVLSLYRRGGRVVKAQLRACDTNNCSDAAFVGPDGSASTYFTEEANSSAGLPSFNFSGLFPASKYFQYQVTLESLNENDSPKLKNVSVSGSE